MKAQFNFLLRSPVYFPVFDQFQLSSEIQGSSHSLPALFSHKTGLVKTLQFVHLWGFFRAGHAEKTDKKQADVVMTQSLKLSTGCMGNEPPCCLAFNLKFLMVI